MTWREHPITTAEQARAMPIGTIAYWPGAAVPVDAAIRCGCGQDYCGWLTAFDGRSETHTAMVGWVALIPDPTASEGPGPSPDVRGDCA